MATSSASLATKPGKNNWIEKTPGGGLPPGIRKVARALMKKRGMSKSQAIATAISMSRKWAAKGSAKGARNTAQFEDLRARNKARQVSASHPAYDGMVLHLSTSYGPDTCPLVSAQVLDLAVPADAAQWLDLAVRRVRTESGVKRFGKPVGSIITRTARGPKIRTGADYVRSAQKASATRQAKVSAAADSLVQVPASKLPGVLAKATPQQLAAMDKEFARRAAALDQPGRISATHQAVRNARRTPGQAAVPARPPTSASGTPRGGSWRAGDLKREQPAAGDGTADPRLAKLTPAQRDAVLAARAKRAQREQTDAAPPAGGQSDLRELPREQLQKRIEGADKILQKTPNNAGAKALRDRLAAEGRRRDVQAQFERGQADTASRAARLEAAKLKAAQARQAGKGYQSPQQRVDAMSDSIVLGRAREERSRMAAGEPPVSAETRDAVLARADMLERAGSAPKPDREMQLLADAMRKSEAAGPRAPKTNTEHPMMADLRKEIAGKVAAGRAADAGARQRAENDRMARAMNLPGADGGRPAPDMSDPQKLSDGELDKALEQAKVRLRQAFEADPKRTGQGFRDAKMHADVVAGEKRRRNTDAQATRRQLTQEQAAQRAQADAAPARTRQEFQAGAATPAIAVLGDKVARDRPNRLRNTTLKGQDDATIAALDTEMARRATLLGRPGQVSPNHQVVKDEMAARGITPKAPAAAPTTPSPAQATAAGSGGAAQWKDDKRGGSASASVSTDDYMATVTGGDIGGGIHTPIEWRVALWSEQGRGNVDVGRGASADDAKRQIAASLQRSQADGLIGADTPIPQAAPVSERAAAVDALVRDVYGGTPSGRATLRERVTGLDDQQRTALGADVDRQLREVYGPGFSPAGESGARAARLEALNDELKRPAGTPEIGALAKMNAGARADAVRALTPEQRAEVSRDNAAEVARLRSRARTGERAELTRQERLAATLQGKDPAVSKPAAAKPSTPKAPTAEAAGVTSGVTAGGLPTRAIPLGGPNGPEGGARPRPTPHVAPHTLKAGDTASVRGTDQYGQPMTLTGKVTGNDAQARFKKGRTTGGEPVRAVSVQREGASGMNRTDTVFVPDPNRGPVRRQSNAQALAESRASSTPARPAEPPALNLDQVAAERGQLADQILQPIGGPASQRADTNPRTVSGTPENIAARQQARAAAVAQPSMFAGAEDQRMTEVQVRRAAGGTGSLFDEPPNNEAAAVATMSPRRPSSAPTQTASVRAAEQEAQRAREQLAQAQAKVQRASGAASGPNDPNLPLGQIVNRTPRQQAQAGARADASIARTAAAFREQKAAEQQVRAKEAKANRVARDAVTVQGVTPETLRTAKFVRDKNGGWHQVKKVNAKSITVPSVVGGSWDDRIPISKIVEVRS